MSPTIAVLGPGAVGGALAVRLALAGRRVVCVARPETAAAIASDGLSLVVGDERLTARSDVVEHLSQPVDLLLVAVKSQTLEAALDRVDAQAVEGSVVVSLLNGLEHVDLLRARLGATTVAGSVSHFQAYRAGLTRIDQLTETLVVTAASADLHAEELASALAPLAVDGVEVRVGADEQSVLWEKLARLGPLAALTALTQLPVGRLRSDPDSRSTLAAAIEESCAVAGADGVALSPADQWSILEGMDPDLTTSSARDVAAGRPSELDAIVGSIVRAGRRHEIATPVLDSLLTRLGIT
jgi:2-dehydropantoate 2-reductase